MKAKIATRRGRYSLRPPWTKQNCTTATAIPSWVRFSSASSRWIRRRLTTTREAGSSWIRSSRTISLRVNNLLRKWVENSGQLLLMVRMKFPLSTKMSNRRKIMQKLRNLRKLRKLRKKRQMGARMKLIFRTSKCQSSWGKLPSRVDPLGTRVNRRRANSSWFSTQILLCNRKSWTCDRVKDLCRICTTSNPRSSSSLSLMRMETTCARPISSNSMCHSLVRRIQVTKRKNSTVKSSQAKRRSQPRTSSWTKLNSSRTVFLRRIIAHRIRWASKNKRINIFKFSQTREVNWTANSLTTAWRCRPSRRSRASSGLGTPARTSQRTITWEGSFWRIRTSCCRILPGSRRRRGRRLRMRRHRVGPRRGCRSQQRAWLNTLCRLKASKMPAESKI